MSRDFRPSQVHQHPEPKTIKPSAREMFVEVRRRRLASRPLLKAATKKSEPVFGEPTFRNVIDENGAWV